VRIIPLRLDATGERIEAFGLIVIAAQVRVL
jgi:hypothetical protein